MGQVMAQALGDSVPIVDWAVSGRALPGELESGDAHLVARLPGRGRGRSLLYSGHIDTVPVGQGGWKESPWSGRISKGRLHGRGSWDMKSGLAAQFATLIALKKAGVRLGGDLLAESVVDEEFAGGGGTLAGRLRGDNADACAIAEGTNHEVVRATRGGQCQILVDLMRARRRHRERVGEEESAAAAIEADAPARAPVPRGQCGLERVRQQQRGLRRELSHRVRGGQARRPRARIRQQRVGQALPREQRRPRPGQRDARLRERVAQRAHGGHGHDGIAEPIGQPHGERLQHHARRAAAAKAARHSASPESRTSRTPSA